MKSLSENITCFLYNESRVLENRLSEKLTSQIPFKLKSKFEIQIYYLDLQLFKNLYFETSNHLKNEYIKNLK
jgi:hypothetical protein